jgi:hypothetical protein
VLGAVSKQTTKEETVLVDSFGLFVIQRQIVRALAHLFITACQSQKSIALLHQQRVFPFLLETLWRHSDPLPSTIRLEACQLIVFTLRISSQITSVLFDDFIGYRGYEVLTQNLIAVGKDGTKEEKAKMIALVVHLLYIVEKPLTITLTTPITMKSLSIEALPSVEATLLSSGTSMPHSFSQDDIGKKRSKAASERAGRSGAPVIGSGDHSQALESEGLLSASDVRNLDGCKILLSAFAACTSADMKTDLLRTIRTVLSLNITFSAACVSMPDPLQISASLFATGTGPTLASMNRPKYSATGYSLLQRRFEPFKVLFLQFDALQLRDQRKILDMMDEVLKKSDLLEEEIKSYCQLLQGKRPSTLLLVSAHMIQLIQRHKVSKVTLRQVGLVPILVEYLVEPRFFFCASLLNNQDERDLALKILYGKSRKREGQEKGLPSSRRERESRRGHSSRGSPSTTPPEHHNLLHRYEGDQADATLSEAARKAKEVTKILYGISIRMLRLMLEFLVDNIPNQAQFRQAEGLRRLYLLLQDNMLRGHVLRVIAICAIGSAELPTDLTDSGEVTPDGVGGSIIRGILHVLQSSGGTATLDRQILLMRRDILLALCYMFRHNEKLKDSFRLHGGFIWSISVMNGIGKSIHQDTEQANSSSESGGANASAGTRAPEEAFIFLKTLLNTLSIALTGNYDNQKYFRQEIRFSALSEALHNCHFIEGSHAIDMCDALLDIAVKYSWPPSCPQHSYGKSSSTPLSSPKQPVKSDDLPPSPRRSSSASSASSTVPELIDSKNWHRDKQVEEAVMSCPRCRNQLLIENPEIFKIIVQLLGPALGKADDLDICYILDKLIFLINVSPTNQHRVAEVGVVGDLLRNFRSVLILSTPSLLDAPPVGQSPRLESIVGQPATGASPLQGNSKAQLQYTVLRLIQKIASHHLTLRALRKYLRLMRDGDDFPVSLLSTLVSVTKREGYPVPAYYLAFTSSRASVALPSLENRHMWPPTSGYTLSFWMNVNNLAAAKEVSPRRKQSVSEVPTTAGQQQPTGSTAASGAEPSEEPGSATPLITFFSTNKACRIEVTLQEGVLMLRSTERDILAFDDFTFQEKRWYHVVITHCFYRNNRVRAQQSTEMCFSRLANSGHSKN